MKNLFVPDLCDNEQKVETMIVGNTLKILQEGVEKESTIKTIKLYIRLILNISEFDQKDISAIHEILKEKTLYKNFSCSDFQWATWDFEYNIDKIQILEEEIQEGLNKYRDICKEFNFSPVFSLKVIGELEFSDYNSNMFSGLMLFPQRRQPGNPNSIIMTLPKKVSTPEIKNNGFLNLLIRKKNKNPNYNNSSYEIVFGGKVRIKEFIVQKFLERTTAGKTIFVPRYYQLNFELSNTKQSSLLVVDKEKFTIKIGILKSTISFNSYKTGLLGDYISTVLKMAKLPKGTVDSFIKTIGTTITNKVVESLK